MTQSNMTQQEFEDLFEQCRDRDLSLAMGDEWHANDYEDPPKPQRVTPVYQRTKDMTRVICPACGLFADVHGTTLNARVRGILALQQGGCLHVGL